MYGCSFWERAEQSGRHHRIQQHENALVTLSPDQPPKRLFDAEPRNPVVVGPFAKGFAPRAMKDVRPRPWNPIKDHQLQ